MADPTLEYGRDSQIRTPSWLSLVAAGLPFFAILGWLYVLTAARLQWHSLAQLRPDRGGWIGFSLLVILPATAILIAIAVLIREAKRGSGFASYAFATIGLIGALVAISGGYLMIQVLAR